MQPSPPTAGLERPAVPLPTEKAAKSGEVALAGRDGAKARDLLANAQRVGERVLSEICEAAFRRRLAAAKRGGAAGDTEPLFTDAERERLAAALASTNATADLLGRARIRERQEKAIGANAGGDRPAAAFGDDQPFEVFDGAPVEPLPPDEAIAYFRGLYPSLNVEPTRFAPMHQRQAFTLAVATEDTLLRKVQEAITQSLADGRPLVDSTAQVQSLLDQVGVSPRNPQYAEMVVRTNMMDAYNAGAGRELRDPDVIDTFPVWQYLGIRDGRQGKDHEPRFDRYYSAELTFEEVRGNRPYNCRCSFRAIDKWEWDDLQAAGATLSKP